MVFKLFAILQKYDFPSKSQLTIDFLLAVFSCLRYCKSTIFQANHNILRRTNAHDCVVCDTAKVRFSKQITTHTQRLTFCAELFAILQKYDFPSKSQQVVKHLIQPFRCLRYCKSTIFQANHNSNVKVHSSINRCLRYCKSTIFQANHNCKRDVQNFMKVVCDTAKVRFSKQITTEASSFPRLKRLFAILQKYDFPSKSQLQPTLNTRQ